MWGISSKRTKLIVCVLTAMVLNGCATVGIESTNRGDMVQVAVREGFKKQYLSAPPFVLTAWLKENGSSDTVVVYIEGDGYAWTSRTEPSDDPTPKHPVAFELAVQDPSPCVVYLARPGQYGSKASLLPGKEYWTRKRYSEEVIQAMSAAIDSLKISLGASKVSLVGYSGGAAVAVLVAVRRHDVISIRTVAGNLAPGVFSDLHHVSQLKDSLDPEAVASSVRLIPQIHFIGDRDAVVPKAVVEAFLDREGDVDHKRLVEIENADHLQGWKQRWRELLDFPLQGVQTE